jgi:integrase
MATPANGSGNVKHRRGFGQIYQRGTVWWICYWHRGRRVRESSKSVDQGAAKHLLKTRLGELGKRHVLSADEAKVTVADLLETLAITYRNDGRRTVETLKYRLAPLLNAFGHDKAVDLSGARVERYKMERREAGKKPATVNRELAALRRAFRLGIEQERITRGPVIKLFPEHNERQGFLDPSTFEVLAANLPDDGLRDAARFAFATGWRKGEIATLDWGDVDRAAGLITLRREHSKNGEPRELPLTPQLAAIIEQRWEARTTTRDGRVTLCHLVFHRDGMPLGDFRKAWKAACRTAGVAGTLFHDLRRSAVRNMDRAKVPQPVAMRISGHKTVSMWKRYRIVNVDDMRDALVSMESSNAIASTANKVIPMRSVRI